MRLTQLLQGQRRRESSGIPHFQAVCEQHDLHAAIVRVIAVSHGVDDCLGHHFHRDFVRPGRPCALRSGADRSVYLTEHEISRLIDQIERRALVNLIRRDGLGDLGSMEMSAPYFGGNQESLRLLSKQQHGGIRDPITVQQIQVLQQLPRRRPLRKWELANVACRADELRHPLEVEIIHRGVAARSPVKWPPADHLPGFQILYQRCVHACLQFRDGVESLPDQSRLSLGYQRLHFRVSRAVTDDLQEDKAV